MSNYISFHNHDSLGSLLDSSLKIKDLVAWAKANKMSYVGTLNHGNLTSCIALWKECNKQEITPILGFEGYVTENKLDESGKKIRDNHHIGLIAKNQTGWFNLIKLHNLSWKEDRYYYDPRITIQDLLDHKEGLIVTSACIGGILGRPFCNDELDKAESVLGILLDNFGNDFYLEMQEHASFNEEDRKKQTNYNKWLIKMSKKYNIKLIIQNDSHYYLKEHWLAHQVLLCKNTGSKLKKPVFAFDSHEYYLKNEAEMVEAFQEYPLQLVEECFKNTKEIAEKCEKFDITNKKYDCPSFGEPEETFKQLSELAQNGLNKKFTASFLKEHPEYQERLDYELSVIKNVGYTDYFLMLDDLYKFTSKKGIYMGIGRGSAGGSLVLYCLGIIFIDPIKYNLLFERFINPSRVSMADVDCDVEDCRRQEVIDYLKKRYGEDHVCNIGTYGEMTAKASFKAVASILEIPFEKANKLSAIMMSDLSLEENFKQVDTFRCAIQNDDKLKQAFEIAKILEGTYAQRGLHACGMVISSKPLDEVCACVTVKDTKSGKRIVATSNEMKEIDGDIKLLKLDILGLRNLTILDNADKLIRKTHGTTIDYKNLDVEDNETFELLSNGYTQCVFQFESKLMQSIIKRVQPKSIDDLSCITALARPGCLDSGLTEQFIKRRNGEEDVIPLVNGIEEYMKDTLQLPVYQENCMQLSRVMAGFNGAEADTLRKCISGDSIISLDNEYITIEQMFKNKDKYIGENIFSTNSNFKTEKDKIVDIFDNGIAKTYKIKTKLGHELICTDTHELMMVDKFRQLKDIKVGDSVAINKKLLLNSVQCDISEKKLRIWAMIIGDGCISGKTGYFCNTDKNLVNYFCDLFKEVYGECIVSKCKTCTGKDIWYIRFNTNHKAYKNIKKHIIGNNSYNKKFDDYIYKLNKTQIIEVLSGLIDTDGSVSSKNTVIEYGSQNIELVEQIANLLSRLGIYASIKEHKAVYNNKPHISYRTFTSGIDTYKLANLLYGYLKTHKNDKLKLIMDEYKNKSSNYDKYCIPKEIIPIIHQEKQNKNLTWVQIDKIANCPRGTMSSGINFSNPNKSLNLARLKKFNKVFNSNIITNLINSDIIWDKIISIEYIGVKHVYDLQTLKNHNYIANNIVVHNCIGKKDPEKLKHEREHFVNGAISLGHSVERANEIFDIIEKFGGYGFNKSHAVGYSLLSYATAYYKTHYPTEYMCAVLNSVTDDLDKLNLYINECYRLGIKVCPPDVNDSEKDFIVNESGELVFGLSAIKGLGKAVVNDIIRARSNKKFISIEDFIERANKADKGSIQALLRVGAFNKLVKYPKRWDLLCDYINDAKNSKYYIDTENLEQAVYYVVGTKTGKKSEKYIEIQEEKRGLKSSRQDKLYREELNKKQDDLLEYYIDVVKRQFLKATTYKPAEKIQNEQELMGFNISTNPYKRWDLFKKYYTRALEGGIPYVELNDLVDDFEKFTDLKSFYTVGLLTDIKELKTKKGQKMAKLTFEYFGSKTTITVFPSDWENNLEFKLQKGNMVSITGYLVETNKQYSDDDYEIRFTSMRQLNVLINENNKCIIDIKNKNIEDINFAVKKLAYSEKTDNLPVERVVVYKNGDKMFVLQGVLWINNPDKLLNYLR